MNDPELSYRNGLAIVRNVREAPPAMSYDARLDAYVAPGHQLAALRTWANDHGVVDTTFVAPDGGGAPILFDPRVPRDYQRTAVDCWLAADGRGSVVLPTGAGKSFVAVLAIHATAARACVVAPTRALVEQWYGQLADAFGANRVSFLPSAPEHVRTRECCP